MDIDITAGTLVMTPKDGQATPLSHALRDRFATFLDLSEPLELSHRDLVWLQKMESEAAGDADREAAKNLRAICSLIGWRGSVTLHVQG